MDLQYLLDKDLPLEWVEPWPGVNADGVDVTCDTVIRASARHCAAMQRHAAPPELRNSLPDLRCLEDFAVTHWATKPRASLPYNLNKEAGFVSMLLACVLQAAADLRDRRDEVGASALWSLIDQLSASPEQFNRVMLAADELKQHYNRTTR